MKYYPYLSIADNAMRNNCSEAAVRKYIKTRGIDRRYERKVNIVNSIRNVLQKDAAASVATIAKETGHSVNTIKEYYPYATNEIELSKRDTSKVSKTDIRQLNNFYATHPSVAQDILNVESFHESVLEPFCGSGTMAEVIRSNGYNVCAYDIVDRGYGQQADFFEAVFPDGEFDIISNPPYSDRLPEIVDKCLAVAVNKVALLLPLNYLSGTQRAEKLYSVHPPKVVYVYEDRIIIGKNGIFDDKFGKITYAWFVWEKGFSGEPTLRWLRNSYEPVRVR